MYDVYACTGIGGGGGLGLQTCHRGLKKNEGWYIVYLNQKGSIPNNRMLLNPQK